jgi:hypothetical protein
VWEMVRKTCCSNRDLARAGAIWDLLELEHRERVAVSLGYTTHSAQDDWGPLCMNWSRVCAPSRHKIASVVLGAKFAGITT